MAVVQLSKPRPKCRICGSRSHVVTVANPHSPRLGCCASCGHATALLSDLLGIVGEQRLHQLVSRALEIHAEQLSLGVAPPVAL